MVRNLAIIWLESKKEEPVNREKLLAEEELLAEIEALCHEL